MSIPHHIHQTWKNNNIPAHLNAYVQSWRDHHPDWTYTLWTDAMNRDFIATHYPLFLPVYDRYPNAIQRVDAVRYFILLQQGGVFVDLDFECLKPIGPLLEGVDFVAGKEPQEHAVAHGKRYIISNAFMAAIPGCRFLHDICGVLQENDYRRYAGQTGFNFILDCAGPFMLSRVYGQYERKQEIRIAEAELLYPLVKDPRSNEVDPEADHAQLAEAYAVHHYWGSWWK